MSFRRMILNILHPIAIAIGKFHLPYTVKNTWLLEDKTLNTLYSLLQPGDVLLSRIEGVPTNLFIPGEWKHAAIYVGNGNVVEAVGKGVVQKHISKFVLSKDKVIMMRPTFCDEKTRVKASMFASKQIGLPYDYNFKAGNKAFYCSELIGAAYAHAMNGRSPFVQRVSLGVSTYVPQDFFNAVEKFEVVWGM